MFIHDNDPYYFERIINNNYESNFSIKAYKNPR